MDLTSATDDYEVFNQSTPSPDTHEDMGIQRKPQRSLQELLESQPRRGEARRSTQPKLPPPLPKSPPRALQPPLPSKAEPLDPKRRREPKGKEVMETGMTRSSSEEEAHRPSKQLKISHAPSRGPEREEVQQPEPQAWLSAPMLGGEPLTEDASIRDYNGGIGCQVTSVLEETLLLPKDMVELRGLRRNEVFLQAKQFLGMVCTVTFQSLLFFFFFFCLLGITLISCYLCVYTLLSLYIFVFVLLLFFFLKQAVQSTFRMEEIYHSVAQQLEDERKRRVSAV